VTFYRLLISNQFGKKVLLLDVCKVVVKVTALQCRGYHQARKRLFFYSKQLYTKSQSQKRPPFHFFELVNDFGVLNPEKIGHENLTDLSTRILREIKRWTFLGHSVHSAIFRRPTHIRL